MKYRVEREKLIESVESGQVWDIVVIGGGASGLGAALDAATRGYKTLLLEQYDFTVGTSSRSTKLVHGGVRYLAQGNVALVLEALKERGLLLNNAPHLVRNQKFLIPSYTWWYKPYYTLGLTLYDLLSGKLSFGRSLPYSTKKTLKKIPTLRQTNLRGSVLYHDGQFDDSRLGVNLMQTVIEKGGVPLNYMKVTGLLKNEGKVCGVIAVDSETQREHNIEAKAVLNATGVFVDGILQQDNPDADDVVMASQGVHIVIDGEFLKSDHAIMIPKTADGRVLFAVPWHDKVIIGTTDIPKEQALIEPEPTNEEIDFILETAGKYLTRKPTRTDIKSIFAGLRPLAASTKGANGKTKEISRSHKIITSKSGLVTIIGGKWTTYRQMGEEVIDRLAAIANLKKTKSKTKNLKIHGFKKNTNFNNSLYFYGSDIGIIEGLIEERPELGEWLSKELNIIKAQVVIAVKSEMARNVIDVLARRTRALFLDAKESIKIAPAVAEILAMELKKDKKWEQEQIELYNTIARNYLINEQ
jgi:glycerol-3-phosphate dehydrogenase